MQALPGENQTQSLTTTRELESASYWVGGGSHKINQQPKIPIQNLANYYFLNQKLHVTDQLVNTGWSRSRCALHGSQARRGVSRVDSISNEKIEIHFSKGVLMLIFPSMFILSVCHIQSEMASVQKTSQPMAKRKYFLNGTETSVSLQRPAGYMAATFIYLFWVCAGCSARTCRSQCDSRCMLSLGDERRVSKGSSVHQELRAVLLGGRW